jgi:transposase
MAWGRTFWCDVRRSIPSSSAGTRFELVRLSGRSLREVGQQLGVNQETLRSWVNAAKRGEAGCPDGVDEISAGEKEELRRLRKKVAELELETEILRKAAQYFAKELGR